MKMEQGQNKPDEIFSCTRIAEFQNYLHQEERSRNTITKYIRDLKVFFTFLDGQPMAKEALLDWKKHLTQTHAPASVNSMLAAVNGFLEWSGMPLMKVKPLKIQKCLFAKPEKELTQEEYWRLIKAAEEKDNHRLAMLLQTICATGIRVSEVRHITVEAVGIGQANVDCKGKNRVVFLPKVLCRALQRYCRKHGIDSGPVFKTAGGKPLDRTNIWRDMKALCNRAGVEPGKVFPHNLRHLFARTYYKLEKDLSRLADLLGHSSVTTTRIYTMESGKSHIRQLERIGLVLAKK